MLVEKVFSEIRYWLRIRVDVDGYFFIIKNTLCLGEIVGGIRIEVEWLWGLRGVIIFNRLVLFLCMLFVLKMCIGW